MPPRYAYWTIIVDNAPTAFRSGSKEELLPTFNRLKEKHASAVMMWWQNGKLWPSRLDAQEAMRARGEIGRRKDPRQFDRSDRPARRSFSEGGQPFRDREQKPFRERQDRGERSAWTPRGEPSTPPPARNADNKLDWKPKGEFTPAPKRADREGRRDERRDDRREERPRSFKRPDFKPSGDDTRSAKPEWKPKGSFTPQARRPQARKEFGSRPEKSEWKPRSEGKSDWRPKSEKSGAESRGPRRSAERESGPEWKPRSSEKPEWRPKSDGAGRPPRADSRKSSAGGRLDWTPKSGYTDKADRPAVEKRKWVPKAEYKKALGIEPKKDSKWRPGGEHRDPKQKYKDAKKAKWTQYKQNIRKRWEAKGGKKSDD